MIAGINAPFMGIRPNAFSVSFSTRDTNKTILAELLDVASIFTGAEEIGLLIRRALTECLTYDCALNMLASAPLAGEDYITVSGVKAYEGAIISKSR